MLHTNNLQAVRVGLEQLVIIHSLVPIHDSLWNETVEFN